MRALTIVLLAVACVGCSKAVVHQTSNDLKAAATDIKNDPAVKRLGTDAKIAVRDAGAEVKKDAAVAKVEAQKAGNDAKTEAHKAGDEAKETVNDADHKS